MLKHISFSPFSMSIFRTNLETTISNVSLRSTSLHMQLNKQYIRFIKYLHHCNIGGSFSIYRFGIPNPQTDLTSGCDQIIFWSHLDHIWPFGGLVNTYTASPSLRMPPRGARTVLLFLKKKKSWKCLFDTSGGLYETWRPYAPWNLRLKVRQWRN